MDSRLKNAEERIEKALERIDVALSQQSCSQTSELRILDLEKENTELRSQIDQTAGRLDIAIKRLQHLLEVR